MIETMEYTEVVCQTIFTLTSVKQSQTAKRQGHEVRFPSDSKQIQGQCNILHLTLNCNYIFMTGSRIAFMH